MRKLFVLALFAMQIPVAARAADVVERKPGLWEIDRRTVGSFLNFAPIQLCVGAPDDFLVSELAEIGPACEPLQITRTAMGASFKTICKLRETTAAVTGEFAGDFANFYSGEVARRYEPPVRGVTDMTSLIAAKYLGECKEGQKPGDAIMGTVAKPPTSPPKTEPIKP